MIDPQEIPTKVQKVTVMINVEAEISYIGEYTHERNNDWIKHQLNNLGSEISRCSLVDKAEIVDIERG